MDKKTCWGIGGIERGHFLQLHFKGVRYRSFPPTLRIPWLLLDSDMVSLFPLVPPKPLSRPLQWEEGISSHLLTFSLGIVFPRFHLTCEFILEWGTVGIQWDR